MIAQILAAIVALVPAFGKILDLFDKWFSKSPEQKAAEELERQQKAEKVKDSEINEAIKDAQKSATKKIEDILNRR